MLDMAVVGARNGRSDEETALLVLERADGGGGEARLAGA